MKYSSILLIIAFVSIAQQFYGQEKCTIWGELPDHSLDNSYLRLVNNSAIGQEYERMKHSFIDSILVVDGKFHYEGVLSQKPFLAYLSSARTGRNMLDLGLYFIVEPGNIHIRIANWADKGIVSGTPINDDYNRCIIEQQKKVDRERSLQNRSASFRDAYIHANECRLFFLEKYAQYPDVVRFHLSFLLNGRRASKDPDFPKYLRILDRMPKADRDILLAWRDYTIKREEYREKTKPLLDSIRDNAPRFIETIPSSSSSTTIKNE